jgi:hypothetical protein
MFWCAHAAGKSFGSPTSWAQLASVDVCLKLMPAVGGACLLWLVSLYSPLHTIRLFESMHARS